VPFGPPRQHAFDGPDDPTTLYVYAGRDGAFALYGDDGLSNAYESGAWTRIPLTWSDAAGTLTIGTLAGGYAGAPKERAFEVVLVRPGAATAIGAGPGRHVRYEGREIVLTLGR